MVQNYTKESLQHVQRNLMKSIVPPDLFQPYVTEICDQLKEDIFPKFLESDKFTRFCQWKNLELNMQLTMNDFSGGPNQLWVYPIPMLLQCTASLAGAVLGRSTGVERRIQGLKQNGDHIVWEFTAKCTQ